jgi:hypothetical protein
MKYLKLKPMLVSNYLHMDIKKEIHMEKQYGDYHGDEDEIESDKQEKEDNDPRHEPGYYD